MGRSLLLVLLLALQAHHAPAMEHPESWAYARWIDCRLGAWIPQAGHTGHGGAWIPWGPDADGAAATDAAAAAPVFNADKAIKVTGVVRRRVYKGNFTQPAFIGEAGGEFAGCTNNGKNQTWENEEGVDFFEEAFETVNAKHLPLFHYADAKNIVNLRVVSRGYLLHFIFREQFPNGESSMKVLKAHYCDRDVRSLASDRVHRDQREREQQWRAANAFEISAPEHEVCCQTPLWKNQQTLLTHW